MERIGLRDTGQDFEHPALPPGHELRPHCLYRLTRDEWKSSAASRAAAHHAAAPCFGKVDDIPST